MDWKPDSVVPDLSVLEKSSETSDWEYMDVEFLGSMAEGKEIVSENENLESDEFKDWELMDVDSGSDRMASSEPYFLKRVLCTEFSDTKLVFLAIDAVFLESGFVGFDSASGSRVDFFDILKERASTALASMAFVTTVTYTLPELLSSDKGTVSESIVLKFQILGHYVIVYGSLSRSPVGLRRLNVDKSRLASAVARFCDIPNGTDSTEVFAEEVVFDFWKFVKDRLALPLMIELREKTGLDCPPCFMRLPADLKFRILELLCGQDTARVACVCKELHYLSSANELWKQKYMAQFGCRTGAGAGHSGSWKKRFELCFLKDSKNGKRGNYMWNSWKNRVFRGFPMGLYASLSARAQAPIASFEYSTHRS